MTGYIYIRNHESYDKYNTYKLGKTTNIPERDSQYATSENERGYFKDVYEIFSLENQLSSIELKLQEEFSYLNRRRNAGVEFYDRKIIDLIEPYFINNNIKYKKLTKEEINFIKRHQRLINIKNFNNLKKIINLLDIKKFIQRLKKNKIKPNFQQKDVLDNIKKFYTENNIGKINWACGLGKALLSILIVKKLEFKSIIIGVPNNYLQQQIRKEILKIFPNKSDILLVGSDIIDKDNKSTTDKEVIKLFINNNETKFIITTYHSCHLLVNINKKFDFKIGDEAHHLVGLEKENGFNSFHKIESVKSLFMTATEKIIEVKKDNKKIYSMDDEVIFGKFIDKKTIYWAIENKKITDYNILILKNTEKEVNEIINNLKINVCNTDLFISSYMCLKSFEKYNNLTHLLLYTNTIEESDLANDYIDNILDLNILSIKKENIYNKSLHSKNCNNLKKEIDKFENSIYGIISCVYIFGEGFDLPKLNGVCIF